MRLRAIIPQKPELTFIIEEDETVGFYLYIYKNKKCLFDYLQDTLKIAQQQAEEEFGVPVDSWVIEEE